MIKPALESEERLVETIQDIAESPELYNSFIQQWQDLNNLDSKGGAVPCEQDCRN